MSKGANIIIATPGRLEDLLMRREDSRIALAVKHLVIIHILNFIPLQRYTVI